MRYDGHLERASVMFQTSACRTATCTTTSSLLQPVHRHHRCASRSAARLTSSALVHANIEFSCDTDSTVQSGATYNVIRIAPGLRCEVRFDPDFENGRIVATLRNVDRFEPVILDFETPALDTRALDDLVNLMLAKPSQFLLRAPLRGFVR